MEYVAARYLNYLDEMQYRIYITDTLKACFELNVRWYDLIRPKPAAPEKTADEIKAELTEKYGITFVEEGEP